MKLWQLKKLSTNQALNEPQKLPENWGPIFGLLGIKEQLGNLEWLGAAYEDMGWVEIEGTDYVDPSESTLADKEWARAKILLLESDWSMLPDVIMTRDTKTRWEEYRKALREIKLQVGFPDSIVWPTKPE